MSKDSKCGICGVYPKWLQGLATTRSFIAVYGLLGTVQSMAFIYIVVSLTTLEKRFKIPSRATGIILSGNEISQILSVFLIYYGGAGHKTRWVAIGVACSALSCLVLALPHFIYGPGQDALALTKEYLNSTIVLQNKSDLPICTETSKPEICEESTGWTDTSIVPKLLVFFSQFILGIGTTLYYGLGQTYLDDNTKKKNTPKLLGITFALRTVGPAFGFILSYLCLNLYIDPTLHPIIDTKDPRWLGAWWLGWLIFGTTFTILAFFLAMFPRELKKSKSTSKTKHLLSEQELPLKIDSAKLEKIKYQPTTIKLSVEEPSIKEFPKAVKRILTNKILITNIFSGVFYILSAAPFMSYITKYLEVQFQTSPGGGSIITGPLTLIGMVLGFLISGIVIGRYKPSPRPLLFWNVIVGFTYFFGQISFSFLGCDSGALRGVNFDTMNVNLTASCNVACNCDIVKYSPVCHEPSRVTYFSACHAGCQRIVNDTTFGDCSCVTDATPSFDNRSHPTHRHHHQHYHDHHRWEANNHPPLQLLPNRSLDDPSVRAPYDDDLVTAGPCKQDCLWPYLVFSFVTMTVNIIGCSGRIGNVLINYRCVDVKDKSLALGVGLMIMSLFALIPGPIIFGAIMDATCVVWDISCHNRGNCWVYHKEKFRYYVNLTSAAFCLIGVFFDIVVCYLAKGVDLYGEQEEQHKRNLTLSNDENESKVIVEN